MKSQTLPTVSGRLRTSLKSGVLLLIATLFLAVCTPTLWGSVTGSISGVVSDSTGAVVPSATVGALSAETGIKKTTQTDAQGVYTFPVLPTGHYDFADQHPGARRSGFRRRWTWRKLKSSGRTIRSSKLYILGKNTVKREIPHIQTFLGHPVHSQKHATH